MMIGFEAAKALKAMGFAQDWRDEFLRWEQVEVLTSDSLTGPVRFERQWSVRAAATDDDAPEGEWYAAPDTLDALNWLEVEHGYVWETRLVWKGGDHKRLWTALQLTSSAPYDVAADDADGLLIAAAAHYQTHYQAQQQPAPP